MLIDANALIHRAYHALPPLTSPKGELVNAVYGFASALLKALKDEKPEYVVACWDAGRHTFRNDIYPEYKATRAETDEALYLQIPRTKQLVVALNIPLYAQEGVEADDLIGSLAKNAAKKGLRTVIVTGDNDTLQLVDDSTGVYSLSRGVSDTLVYDTTKVKDKLGVMPRQVIDYKALAGDSSDNIPGVPGFGPKTASELLTKYDTIEGIYEHLDELSPRQKQLLIEHKDLMAISRRLGAIKVDLDIELDLKSAETSHFDFSKAINFFQEMGFKSLISRIPNHQATVQSNLFAPGTDASPPPAPSTQERLPYRLLKTVEETKTLLKRLAKVDKLVIDTETIDLEGELIGIAFGWSATESAYLPLAPVYPGGVPIEEVRADLQKVLNSKTIKKIGHNLKYDLAVLSRAGLPVEGVWFDTMIAASLLATGPMSIRLDDLSISELGFRKISIAELIGAKKSAPMTDVPAEQLAEYSCEDALITWRLFEHYFPQLEDRSFKRVFYEIEMPLMSVLEKMEARGITIDLKHLKNLSKKLAERLTALQASIQKEAGETFNVNSPIQLKTILFEKLNLETAGVKRMKSGLSTDAETLSKLKEAHPIVPMLLEYRELSKLMSTYIETLPKLADANGRVHTTYSQLGAATGRLASNNPNLQNIPIRTELGTDVRRAFVAGPGKILLGADYSQIELRIVAHMSNDPKLIETFTNGQDVHKAVSDLLNVDRRTAKAINYGIIYGLGSNALANDLGISIGQAKEHIEHYLDQFPGIVKYMKEMREQAHSQGYVETLFGRRRYLPDIHSPNPGLRAAAERMAINSPAQGTNADLVKLAMVELDRTLPEGAAMLLSIHDELVFEIEPDQLAKIAKLVREKMSNVMELKVPITVEVKSGPNWADLAPLEIKNQISKSKDISKT